MNANGNLIWLVCGGFFAALLFITVIDIPFGRQHLKLVEPTLAPFGKKLLIINK